MVAPTSRVLVTGASGFLGGHLLGLLVAECVEVIAACRTPPSSPDRDHRNLTWHRLDVRDPEAVSDLVRRARPDVIFHLAALVHSGEMRALMATNVVGTDNLLRASAPLPDPPRVVIAGSAAEYGLSAATGRLDEDAPLRPLTPYGISKAAQTLTALAFAARAEVPVIVGRVFNMVGPGESPETLAGSVARQLAQAERRCRRSGEPKESRKSSPAACGPPIRVGNLDTWRDYVDVRDVAHALLLLGGLEGRGSTYNVCSGVARRTGDLVERLAALSDAPVAVTSVASRRRQDEIVRVVGAPDRLKADTGWTPSFRFEDSLRDLLNWYR